MSVSEEATIRKDLVTKVADKRPCLAEAEASRICMETSGYVRSKCFLQFQAYKDCKTVLYERKKKERNDAFWSR